MDKLNALFGRRVRTLRKGHGLTLEGLGRAAGVGYKHIAEIERGVKVPSFDAIERLAKALKAEPYELFLPERLPVGDADRNLRLLIAGIERHGTAEMKQFMAEVLAAAQTLARSA